MVQPITGTTMESGQHSGSRQVQQAEQPGDAASGAPRDPMVVGIGASAGGLAALKQFLAHVPGNSGIAFVVIVHLSPSHESHLADLLQPHASVPVHQVTETMRLEPDHVYVIPPGANLNTIDTHLRLSKLEERRRERAPIDHFFRTLSETHGERAIGVVLTGTGSDGTMGLREIKERGGLTIAQDPREAELDGMPQNAVTAGRVDLVLPVTEMPAHILRFASTKPRVPVPEEGQEFLSTVTSFFRDADIYEYLATEVVPRLFEGKSPEDRVRVWSVGCSTGEEAYSLAILLCEHAAGLENPPEVQVFASDLHERSLKRAREGLYPESIESDVTSERLGRFFVKENAGYRVRQELRELLVFAPHNLLRDPPFAHMDLITCRNLLIYLQRDIPGDVIDLFHYALEPNGYLYLGTSESVESSDLFRAESRGKGIFRRRNVPPPEVRVPRFPLSSSRKGHGRRLDERAQDTGAVNIDSYGALHQTMLERYAPPSVLVNSDHNIVHYSERAWRYMAHPGGTPTSSLFNLVRQELRIELRAGLHAARTRGTTWRSRPVETVIDGEPRRVVLHIRPAEEQILSGFALVIFDEIDGLEEESVAERAGSENSGREVEAELDLTKRRRQSVIEEYETGQEETRATVEELQSANEELRFTLEELETSREELQSMNEELQTVNQENRHKVEELSQLSSDLQNLLAATDIATLFLDRNLRIMRFTPRVEELFNVRLRDRGRPLSDLTHRLGDHQLDGDARQVLERLVPVEREIQSVDRRWYLVRVLPYRAAEDRIDGVVVTFVEVTLLKRAQDALRKSEERLLLLMENVKEYAIFMTDIEGRIATWNTGAERLFGYTEKQAVGKTAAIIFTDEDRAAGAPRAEMEQAERTSEAADDRWHVRRDGTRFWGSGVMVALHQPDGELRGFAKVLRDNTERKEAEDQLRTWNEELEERVVQRTEQVRSLASTLTMAEQGERRRISQVLHDNLQQILYGIQMKLSFIRKDAESGKTEQILKNAEEANGWLDDAIRTTRQLTIDLSPPVLQGEGLTEALKWLVSQMKELHHLDVTLDAGTTSYAPAEEMRMLLFQIVRELLFNVAKHAEVDRASVILREEDHHLVIHVVDKGKGMDVATLESDGAGFGLFHARERLGLFGGRMEVAASPGEGTRVTIFAPVEES